MKARMIAFMGQNHDLYSSRLQREKGEWNFLAKLTAACRCHSQEVMAFGGGGSDSAKASAISRRPNTTAVNEVTANGDDGGDGNESDPERPSILKVRQTTPTASAHNATAYTPGKSRILRMSEVTVRTGYSRASIYGLMRTGQFPISFKLGARAIGFLETEIDQWIESRINARGESK